MDTYRLHHVITHLLLLLSLVSLFLSSCLTRFVFYLNREDNFRERPGDRDSCRWKRERKLEICNLKHKYKYLCMLFSSYVRMLILMDVWMYGHYGYAMDLDFLYLYLNVYVRPWRVRGMLRLRSKWRGYDVLLNAQRQVYFLTCSFSLTLAYVHLLLYIFIIIIYKYVCVYTYSL